MGDKCRNQQPRYVAHGSRFGSVLLSLWMADMRGLVVGASVVGFSPSRRHHRDCCRLGRRSVSCWYSTDLCHDCGV